MPSAFCTFFLKLLLSSLLIPLSSANANLNNNEISLASTSITGTGCFKAAGALSPSTFKVLVPYKTYFTQFVDCSDPNYVRGFSVDVFKSALSILRPQAPWENVSFQCFDFESKDANYDKLVRCLSEGSVDAVVGDVTIGARRMEIASFSQPYVNAGIVILAPMVGQRNKFPGIVFAPFSAQMWSSICGFSVVTGCVLWLLERDSHREFTHGPVKQRIQKSLRFVAHVMVFFERETITNLLAKAVLVSWIVFILVLGSTYTASFSAILTVRKLAPDNLNIQIVQNATYRIGYQATSIVYDYLTETLRISPNRLLGLNSSADYLEALSKGPHKTGGVGVILDEVPYVNLFLSGLSASSCSYLTVGPKLTNEGFGFAFPINSTNLATAFSMAILNLSESGQLQKLRIGAQISDYQCPTQLQSTRLDLISSEWMFVLLGLMLVASIVMFVGTVTPSYSQLCNLIRKKSAVEPEADGNADPGNVSDVDESFHDSDRLESSSSTSALPLLRLGTFP